MALRRKLEVVPFRRRVMVSNIVIRYICIMLAAIATPVVIFVVATVAYKAYYWAAGLLGIAEQSYVATCGVLILAMIVVRYVIYECMGV